MAQDLVRSVIADEIWMEDFRGNGSSCIMLAFSPGLAPAGDLWAPFKAAIGDGNPEYRGGIVAAIEFHFVGSIKGRLIYASSKVVAPACPNEFETGVLVQVKMKPVATSIAAGQ